MTSTIKPKSLMLTLAVLRCGLLGLLVDLRRFLDADLFAATVDRQRRGNRLKPTVAGLTAARSSL